MTTCLLAVGFNSLPHSVILEMVKIVPTSAINELLHYSKRRGSALSYKPAQLGLPDKDCEIKCLFISWMLLNILSYNGIIVLRPILR